LSLVICLNCNKSFPFEIFVTFYVFLKFVYFSGTFLQLWSQCITCCLRVGSEAIVQAAVIPADPLVHVSAPAQQSGHCHFTRHHHGNVVVAFFH